MSKDPTSWTAEKLFKGYYADYVSPTMVDGVGIRGSLYVSGCPFNCKGCYNKQVQDFRYGEPFTEEVADHILADLDRPTIKGISFLGGEPFLNTPTLIPLAKRIRKELPGKDIWAWSGYTYEELTLIDTSVDKKELLMLVDVLVDGQFEQDKYRPDLVFRGSWNQRIIDVPASTQAGIVVLWRNGEYLEHETHEPIRKTQP